MHKILLYFCKWLWCKNLITSLYTFVKIFPHSLQKNFIYNTFFIFSFLTEPQDLLWVDKYRPRSTKSIIGQQGDRSNAKKLSQWLQNWDKNHQRGGEKGGAKRPLPWGGSGGREDGSSFKAALLSGPPGIGKTTTATLVCQVGSSTWQMAELMV